MGTMCKRSNYTQNAPQYEGDCEYRISSILCLFISESIFLPHITVITVKVMQVQSCLTKEMYKLFLITLLRMFKPQMILLKHQEMLLLAPLQL